MSCSIAVNDSFFYALVRKCFDRAVILLERKGNFLHGRGYKVSIAEYISDNDWARTNVRTNAMTFARKSLSLDDKTLEGLINHEIAHLASQHARHDDGWLEVCNKLGGLTQTKMESQ